MSEQSEAPPTLPGLGRTWIPVDPVVAIAFSLQQYRLWHAALERTLADREQTLQVQAPLVARGRKFADHGRQKGIILSPLWQTVYTFLVGDPGATNADVRNHL